MGYSVAIRPCSSRAPMLIIGEQHAKNLGMAGRKRGYVSFGIQKNFIDVDISKELNNSEIVLSAGVIEDLHIPNYPDFEVRAAGNEIIIGPCIGILAGRRFKDISKRRLREISMSALDYPRIHGAIIVFSLDRVDKLNRLVEGYCYNPKSDSWNEGIFPYPLAIFLRSSLDDEWKNHFLSIIGDNVFNNYSFDKWEMYLWFSQEADIVPHLPYTRLYQSKQDIYDMLEKHRMVYIKPIRGMKGFGVVRAGSEGGKVAFKYRKADDNAIIYAANTFETDRTIERLFKQGGHIIQQGLDLIEYRGGVVDFRCVMQKEDRFNWACSGIVARAGAKDSVVSNISSGGAALPAAVMIKDALSVSDAHVFALKDRMISLCMKVCRALDGYGINCGVLGLDLGLDKSGNIWLIEVNNRCPHPAIALRANEILSYYTILASPLYYARSLAGFGPWKEG